MRKVLVVGGGGREHALCWKLSQEADVFCCPGNPGISREAEVFRVPVDDIEGILGLAFDIHPELVVVGPENPLIDGLGDALRAKGHLVFGPNADGARLEGSKAWSKEMMRAAGVPTARSFATSDLTEAQTFIGQIYNAGLGAVIKASGAAVGKGVTVCNDRTEANEAAKEFLYYKKHGSAGDTILIEERLSGREFSLMTLVNGQSFVSLPVAQDYKRVGTGDIGPNTGGMGSFAPALWVDNDVIFKTEATVVKPIVQELVKRGIDFRGVIFSGLMVVDGEPMCIEYNVRFGDPETQSLMRILGGGFMDALVSTARGEHISHITRNHLSAVSLVLAAHGYPDAVRTGDAITATPLSDGVVAFYGGAKIQDGKLVTSGGRVATLSAVGNTVDEARQKAYQAVQSFNFEGRHFRMDVAAS